MNRLCGVWKFPVGFEPLRFAEFGRIIRKIPRYGIPGGTDYDIAVHRRKLIRVVVDAKRSYENLRSGVFGINSVYEGLRGKLIVFVFGVFRAARARAHAYRIGFDNVEKFLRSGSFRAVMPRLI